MIFPVRRQINPKPETSSALRVPEPCGPNDSKHRKRKSKLESITWGAMDDDVWDPLAVSGLSAGVVRHRLGRDDGRRRGRAFAAVGPQTYLFRENEVGQ
jgi:hypothetical protein